MAYQQQQTPNGGLKMQAEPYLLKEDEKIPLFLVKVGEVHSLKSALSNLAVEYR